MKYGTDVGANGILFEHHINPVIPTRDTAVADLEPLPGSWVQGWKARAPQWTSQPFESRSMFEQRIIGDLQRAGQVGEIVHVYERGGHFERNHAGQLLTE
jgi:hypothetical protein